jgi:alpha-glucosidase (family GH31 glycosyl hydrolase)
MPAPPTRFFAARFFMVLAALLLAFGARAQRAEAGPPGTDPFGHPVAPEVPGGRYKSHTYQNGILTIRATDGSTRQVQPWAEGVVKISYFWPGRRPVADSSVSVVQPPAAYDPQATATLLPLDDAKRYGFAYPYPSTARFLPPMVVTRAKAVRSTATSVQLFTEHQLITINKHTLAVNWQDFYEAAFFGEAAPAYRRRPTTSPAPNTPPGRLDELASLGVRFRLQPGERLYGTGARALPLDRRGYRLELYNQAHYGYQNGEPNLNVALPVVLSSRGYLLLFDHHAAGYLDLGKKNPDVLEYGLENACSHSYIGELCNDKLSYFVVTGRSQAEILDRYTALTGRQPLPPRWALGLIQSRFGYRSQAETRAWLWAQYSRLHDQGTAGWWSDLGEPENHPDAMYHRFGKGRLPARQVHNAYGLAWAKIFQDNYEKAYPDERLFNLARSGWAGMQRHSVFPWSGDVSRTWSGLQAQVPIMLGMGQAGVGYMHSDAGGFGANATQDPELYTRWLQMAAFGPILRPHSDQVVAPEPYKSIVRHYTHLRAELLPYLYTLAAENTLTGAPLARALDFTGHPSVGAWDSSSYPYAILDKNTATDVPTTPLLNSQFLLGSSLLVAPVSEPGQRRRNVFLPATLGGWVDFETSQTLPSGQPVGLPAPLGHIPLLVRAGAFVPLTAYRASAAHYRPDTLAVRYYSQAGARRKPVLFHALRRRRPLSTGACSRAIRYHPILWSLLGGWLARPAGGHFGPESRGLRGRAR